uniref:F-box associated domain-containing protein n=1 Tax=Fagus sylvatica TaxID=28930 RepID=A0A2N9G4J6_FAGSY
MKLVAGPSGSDHFRFLFVELVENRPILFVYDSQSEKWESMEVKENVANLPCLSERESHYIYLSVINGRSESVLIVVNSHGTTSKPLILRPRFGSGGVDDGQLTVRFSWGNVIDRLHVYGDGHMIIMMSDGIDKMMLTGIELWGLSLDGRYWQYISKVPSKLMEQIKKPYGVMVGCLEERDGIVRAALMSNFEGLWHIIWLTYDIKTRHWIRVIVPDCKMKGSNMAGIAFSSGITLS